MLMKDPVDHSPRMNCREPVAMWHCAPRCVRLWPVRREAPSATIALTVAASALSAFHRLSDTFAPFVRQSVRRMNGANRY